MKKSKLQVNYNRIQAENESLRKDILALVTYTMEEPSVRSRWEIVLDMERMVMSGDTSKVPNQFSGLVGKPIPKNWKTDIPYGFPGGVQEQINELNKGSHDDFQDQSERLIDDAFQEIIKKWIVNEKPLSKQIILHRKIRRIK